MLNSINDIAAGVTLPNYDLQAHGTGIVHLGLGAFHRAHQAVYTDDALAKDGGDWRIIGVSLRSTNIADAMNAQNGLYSLAVKGNGPTATRIIGSIKEVIAASRDRDALLVALADETTRILSLTVTEKAYGIDRTGKIMPDDPAIAPDLKNPRAPSGTVGIIVEGLRLRKQKGIKPFTVLCCDNLPENGQLIRNGTIDFATQIDRELGQWIADNVAFPSTMVDRITPASTNTTLSEAKEALGKEDMAAIETEPFTQWVIEDNFPTGRPAWETGGAIFVDDVAPYEDMKLRMLNGSHSLIAYVGFMASCKYVRDTMAYAPLSKLVARHMKAAAATLAPVGEIDLVAYEAELLERFANPSIAHETYQIAMDGTQKLPQRLINPALHAITNNQDIRSFAFAIAAWMRYCLGKNDNGETYELRDPREAEIKQALEGLPREATKIADALEALPDLLPAELTQNENWHNTIREILAQMLEQGMRKSIESEAR